MLNSITLSCIGLPAAAFGLLLWLVPPPHAASSTTAVTTAAASVAPRHYGERRSPHHPPVHPIPLDRASRCRRRVALHHTGVYAVAVRPAMMAGNVIAARPAVSGHSGWRPELSELLRLRAEYGGARQEDGQVDEHRQVRDCEHDADGRQRIDPERGALSPGVAHAEAGCRQGRRETRRWAPRQGRPRKVSKRGEYQKASQASSQKSQAASAQAKPARMSLRAGMGAYGTARCSSAGGAPSPVLGSAPHCGQPLAAALTAAPQFAQLITVMAGRPSASRPHVYSLPGQGGPAHKRRAMWQFLRRSAPLRGARRSSLRQRAPDREPRVSDSRLCLVVSRKTHGRRGAGQARRAPPRNIGSHARRTLCLSRASPEM